MSVYKLFGNMTGGAQNDISALDIQFSGVLYGVSFSGFARLDAGQEAFQAEVSFLSVSTLLANDARGSICATGQGELHLLTSGVGIVNLNHSISGLEIEVSAGERVHLHTNGTAGVSGSLQCYLYVRDRAMASLRRRR